MVATSNNWSGRWRSSMDHHSSHVRWLPTYVWLSGTGEIWPAVDGRIDTSVHGPRAQSFFGAAEMVQALLEKCSWSWQAKRWEWPHAELKEIPFKVLSIRHQFDGVLTAGVAQSTGLQWSWRVHATEDPSRSKRYHWLGSTQGMRCRMTTCRLTALSVRRMGVNTASLLTLSKPTTEIVWEIVWWFQPTPLKNDGVKVSWDDDSIPNCFWKVHKIQKFQTTR